MAEASKTPTPANVVPHSGDHDRIAMLSVKADGTLDQNRPEVVIAQAEAEAATKRQFAEQAVSAADVVERSAPSSVTLVGQEDGSVKEVPATADPVSAEASALKKAHEEAAGAAEAAAVKVVAALIKGS